MAMEEKRHAPLGEKDKRLKELELSLTESESEVENLTQKVADLEHMLHEIRSSTSYKLAHRLACAVRLVAPRETGRRGALRSATSYSERCPSYEIDSGRPRS